uniref:uncharacterized protein LOC122591635 n=1 Tax=Erigeron canadensis TaxID=72917 RepID=UPI001CB89540|nr:uncharacterized protein LOC122591635 [Erigeron canadensis]
MAPKKTTKAQTLSSAQIERLVAQRVAAAIATYEANRNTGEAEGSGNGGGQANVLKGCTYRDFTLCKPLNFEGTAGTIGLLRGCEKIESVFRISECPDECKVKYATCTLQGGALSWWNLHAHTVGVDAAYALTWEELKEKMRAKYCPRIEIQKLEAEFWNLTTKGLDVSAYTTGFHELALVYPTMVTSSKPTDIKSAVEMTHSLADQMKRQGEREDRIALPSAFDHKRKWDEGSSRNQAQQPPKRAEAVKAYTVAPTAKKGYNGASPYCNKCRSHHRGPCMPPCGRCKRTGHTIQNCRAPNLVVNNNNVVQKGCYECGNEGHMKRDCPRLRNQNNNNNHQARGRAFVIQAGEARQDPNIVTGMFFLENLLDFVLFDSGADLSFISNRIIQLLSTSPAPLDDAYSIELANGKEFKADSIIRECTLTLADKLFHIDLIPVEIGSFDIIIGMDWLSKHKAEIVCHEKVVRIPLEGGDVLIIQGERCGVGINLISCMKTQKYLRKGYDAILAHVTTKEPKEKRLEDVPIAREFPEVFPEDLPRLPPIRQVEFQVDLVPGATPVARAPYRLAPSQMKELSTQLQELLDKGFIRPSSSPWGAPVLFVKKKDGSFRMCIDYR